MNDDHHRSEIDTLARAKAAVRKLALIQRRVQFLIARMIIPHTAKFSSLFGPGFKIDEAERVIRHFADALVTLIRLTATQQRGPDIAIVTKNLEMSQSVHEIVTLIGLTVLGTYGEQIRRRSYIMELWKNEIHPQMGRVAALVEFGNELDTLSRRIQLMLDHDANTGEDDIVRMILSIQNQKFDRFHEICGRLETRVENEERNLRHKI